MKDLSRFLTIFFSIIPLSVLLCNLIEVSDILDLPEGSFQALQEFTLGLSWLIVFEIAALLMTVVLIFVEKKKQRTFRHLLFAAIFYFVSIVLFFIFILPENISTQGWTVLTADWYYDRLHWEYANVIRAVFSLAGFSLVIVALLKNRNYYKVYE
jgi:hypothetical protein